MGPNQGPEKQRKIKVTGGGHGNGVEGLFHLNDRGCRTQAKESACGYGQLGSKNSHQAGK